MSFENPVILMKRLQNLKLNEMLNIMWKFIDLEEVSTVLISQEQS